MNISKVNLKNKFSKVNEYWSPKIVGQLNGQLVKIAKVKGDFIMHEHENEDELFFVNKGTLFIELENETLKLEAGEMVVIPKGIKHRPFSNEEVEIVLFEPATTINTGNEISELTTTELDKI